MGETVELCKFDWNSLMDHGVVAIQFHGEPP